MKKISEGTKKLLTAIRRTVNDDEFTAGDLMTRCAGLRAKENQELSGALGGKFNAKSLGHWLKKYQGAIHEGWRLCADRGRRPRVWLYYFDSLEALGGEAVARDLDVLEREARITQSTPMSRRYLKEVNDQFEAMTAREEEAKAKTRLDQENADFQKAISRPLTTVRVDSEGHTKTEIVIDPRTGEPIMEKPAAAPAPTVPAVKRRPGDTRPTWVLRGESIPRDKAEWLAHQEFRRTGRHPGEDPALWRERSATMFFDPGGVVSRNVMFEPGEHEVSTLFTGNLRDL